MRWVLLMTAICLAGCGLFGGKIASNPAPGLDRESYKLGIGDRLRIEVYGEPDLSLEALIEAGGSINYPLLGRVPATGLTVIDFEQQLAAQLLKGYLVNPRVRVSVAQFRPIYIIGQIQRAGSYPYVQGLTVEKGLALAGGLTPIASTRKIFLLRESAPTTRQRAGLDTVVLPGDTIIVEESLF